MTLCDFNNADRTCPICGYVAKTLPHRRRCHQPGTLARPPAPQPQRRFAVGDAVAAGLAAVGITPARVERATGRRCGCKSRQQRLNEIGYRVQDAAAAAVQTAKEFYLGS